jgi:hypothetical protein
MILFFNSNFKTLFKMHILPQMDIRPQVDGRVYIWNTPTNHHAARIAVRTITGIAASTAVPSWRQPFGIS